MLYERGGLVQTVLKCTVLTFNYLQSEDSISVYEDLFQYACPKFISPNGPNFDDPAALTQVNVSNLV